MSKYRSICPLCGAVIDWLDNPPKLRACNSTPNLSPSPSEPNIIECPDCKLQFYAGTGKEVTFGESTTP